MNPSLHPVTLETPRLIFREITDDDLAALHDYASDGEVAKYMLWGPNTLDETREFVEFVKSCATQENRIAYILGVERKDTGEIIGALDITVVSAAHRRAEIGYVLNRKHWGQGFGTEVGQRAVSFAMDDLDMHRVEATCRPQNIGSARILEKCGLLYEGYLRDHFYVRGVWEDSLLFARTV